MTDKQILDKVDEAMKLGRKQALEQIREEMQEYSNAFCLSGRNDLASAVDNCVRMVDKAIGKTNE